MTHLTSNPARCFGDYLVMLFIVGRCLVDPMPLYEYPEGCGAETEVQDTMLDLVQGVQNVVQGGAGGAECGAGRCRRCRMWCREVQELQNVV